MSKRPWPWLDSDEVACWHCGYPVKRGDLACSRPYPGALSGCGAMGFRQGVPELAVREVTDGHVELHHTHVGSEYNSDDSIGLADADALRLRDELDAVLRSRSSSAASARARRARRPGA